MQQKIQRVRAAHAKARYAQRHAMQLRIQLATLTPCDLDEIELAEYNQLSPRWQQWAWVAAQCAMVTLDLFDSAR